MAELYSAPFRNLVTRLFVEPPRQNALFELPRRRWYVPPAAGPDLSVCFHGEAAGNAAGPAAGPHTQMAQNILLSYVAGARILELKTVQVDDRLTIPRPCIDMTNIGYNVEWSQELRVPDSLREYAAGAMLIHMFRHAIDDHLPIYGGDRETVIYDTSVGYDLAGIQSDKVRRFLDGMRDASAVIAQLRDAIPAQFKAARDLDYKKRLSDSITLSTFHGCPADEIEIISQFLIGDCDFDVIVKMNPPMLGRERLEHLLHDVLGYTELVVNPTAYDSGLVFDEAVQICQRMTDFATARGRRFGYKFSNTLEVVNHRTFFPPDNEVMYLSGQPLYVITLSLTDMFRQAVGPDVPISFSAGIDQHNFATAVGCGFVPITVSSDLLRPGGYGRMPAYLARLGEDMTRVRAGTVDQYVLGCCAQEKAARARAAAEGRADDDSAIVRWAGLLNTTIAAEQARTDPRYHADKNGKVPKRIDSHLTVFDCITCDKCLPVCPNAANFTYPTPLADFAYHDIVIGTDGGIRPADDARHFEITRAMQIACFADFCNECGNCDTFCPEYGGPYIEKPSFFGTIESWREAAPRDGFFVGRDNGHRQILGRIKGHDYSLIDDAAGQHTWSDGTLTVAFDAADHAVVGVSGVDALSADHLVDMWVYHTLRYLLDGITDERRINEVNAGWINS